MENLPMAFHNHRDDSILISKKYGLWIANVSNRTDEERRNAIKRMTGARDFLHDNEEVREQYLSGEVNFMDVLNRMEAL